jgi:hypothetical protein
LTPCSFDKILLRKQGFRPSLFGSGGISRALSRLYVSGWPLKAVRIFFKESEATLNFKEVGPHRV